jgi:hypothetical protein
LLPKIAASAGIEYGALCEDILSGARLHNHAERTRNERHSQVSFTAVVPVSTLGATGE